MDRRKWEREGGKGREKGYERGREREVKGKARRNT